MGVLTLADDNAVRAVILPYLATRGFIEGRNLVVDVRVGVEAQMPELAQALVGDKADVIIAASDWAVHAARAATTTIPIVASPIGADPVRAGVAESWAHPGGTVTGVCLIAPELEVKRLSLLRGLPRCTELGALHHPRSWKRAYCLCARPLPRSDLIGRNHSRSPNEYAAALMPCAGLARKPS
jgi:putative ABC transport system substrate-binding protein